MSSEAVAIHLGKDVIQPIIDVKVQAAIVEALNGQNALVSTFVNNMLNMKVDSSGNWSRNNYSSDKPFAEWLAGQAVTAAAKKALEKYLDEHADELMQVLMKELHRSRQDICKSLIAGLKGSINDRYAFTVQLKNER